MRIGVDLMGSDSSPQVLYQGVLDAIDKLPENVTLCVFSTQKLEPPHPRVELHLVTEFISMEEDPLSSIRLKKDSSLVVGIRSLKDKYIEGFVSAGNTGALIAFSSIALTLLPGIDRAALLAVLPAQTGSFVMLDVGGTHSIKSKNLVQFAQMGAEYQRSLSKIEIPRVGLLNIGIESKKGTVDEQEAYRMLQELAQNPEAGIKFVGNVEGREAFEGKVDVLVTDGFTGNVMLKTSEGVSSFIFSHLHNAMPGLRRELEDIRKHFSYDEYPGALICGIKGIVMKCHGAALPSAVKNSILAVAILARNDRK